jgi:hypothetical protein
LNVPISKTTHPCLYGIISLDKYINTVPSSYKGIDRLYRRLVRVIKTGLGVVGITTEVVMEEVEEVGEVDMDMEDQGWEGIMGIEDINILHRGNWLGMVYILVHRHLEGEEEVDMEEEEEVMHHLHLYL